MTSKVDAKHLFSRHINSGFYITHVEACLGFGSLQDASVIFFFSFFNANLSITSENRCIRQTLQIAKVKWSPAKVDRDCAA